MPDIKVTQETQGTQDTKKTQQPFHVQELMNWIDRQREPMIDLLQAWSNINSSSENLDGLALMLSAIEERCAPLDGQFSRIALPPRTIITSKGESISIPHGQALHGVKRSMAPFKVFLGGHMDTVYDPTHPFQKAERISSECLRGPGVADMKGGLIVMLTALQAFEQHPYAQNIGWEIVINPDEEIGSIGSSNLFAECATRNNCGLLFEPACSDGAIVDARKGSANFTVIARGQAAHAGRDFDHGRNAITALARFIIKAEKLINKESGIILNVGNISGGGPVNIVPDLAICRLNIRTNTKADFIKIESELFAIIAESQNDGLTLTLHPQYARPPKEFDEKSQKLFSKLADCALEENFKLQHRPSGGVCDGNLLAAAGLPVIDTLGVVGGSIHTSEEYILVDSLVARARLTTRLLIKLAEESLF